MRDDAGAIIIWKYGPGLDFEIKADGVLNWNDPEIPKPTDGDIAEWGLEFDAYIKLIVWEEGIRAAYAAAGVTFERWNELVIEKDTAGQAQYRVDRDAVRLANPKP